VDRADGEGSERGSERGRVVEESEEELAKGWGLGVAATTLRCPMRGPWRRRRSPGRPLACYSLMGLEKEGGGEKKGQRRLRGRGRAAEERERARDPRRTEGQPPEGTRGSQGEPGNLLEVPEWAYGKSNIVEDPADDERSTCLGSQAFWTPTTTAVSVPLAPLPTPAAPSWEPRPWLQGMLRLPF